MMPKLSQRLQATSCWKSGYVLSFSIGFLSLLVVLLPILFVEGGNFIYYGDYNAQQIPFYYHAAEMVKSGSFGWDWYTDLGSSFLGSYSFYLLGSPFFWLTALLPQSCVIYAMPVMLALKHGVAALTAYAYIRRFVRNQTAAILGGLLYAFSGFQIINLFFNHFQDVTALFPLTLLAMEELITKNRKGVFALSVALLALVNYFFFTGIAVFLVLYFVLRCFSSDFPATPKRFFLLLLEAILGVLLAAVILLPSALALLSNYRITEYLYGLDLVAYQDKTRIWRILQSFFMIPDATSRPNLFHVNSAKWASMGGHLPLFSMVGVIAFLKHRDGHWAKRLTILCTICAFVPVLNSSFYMLNGSYYARWYYMPILIMALMTAMVLDTDPAAQEDHTAPERRFIPLWDGIWISGVFLAAFGIISLLPKKDAKTGAVTFFSLPGYPWHFYLTLGLAVLCLAAVVVLAKRRRAGKPFLQAALILTIACCVINTATIVYFGAVTPTQASQYIDKAIDREQEVTISVAEDDFFRVDISKDKDNYPMLWSLPNMRCFHSVVSGSIMEFYAAIGQKRDVASRMDTDLYALRGLFSVKYYFDAITEDNVNDENPTCGMPGFQPYDILNGFYVYENTDYVPMGFTFDHYVSRQNWDAMTDEIRTNVLMHALVLTPEQIDQYGDTLTELKQPASLCTEQGYRNACAERAAAACSSFTYDSSGFTAQYTGDRDNLVFFSVPYDEGWSATVNGKPASVELVDGGFLAIPVSAGENTIVVTYTTPGVFAGFLLTCLGAAALLCYVLLARRLAKRTA